MKVGEAIAKVLKAEGVEVLFAYPVNPIIEAAAKEDIRTVIVRQERIGLHMADAYSRLSSGERIGVFCMQHGPGAENAFGGVAQAYSESVPILVMPGRLPPAAGQLLPQLQRRGEHARGHQVGGAADPRAGAAGCDAPRILPVAQWPAGAGFGGGARGPVPGGTCRTIGSIPRATAPVPARTRRPWPPLARVLAAAERPVIYAGQGVHYAQAWPQLQSLAETWNIPVTTQHRGQERLCGGSSLLPRLRWAVQPASGQGFSGRSGRYPRFRVQLRPDRLWGADAPGQDHHPHATLDPMDLNKDVPAQYGLIGDAKLTLEALARAMEGQDRAMAQGRADVPARIAGLRDAWLGEWMPKLTADQAPINPYRVLWELNALVDKNNVIITHDAGSPRDQITPFWQATAPLSYIGWGKTTQLGYGLGLAMGAKLAHPDKLCINVWGDAAIGFTGMDFETAVRERIPILSILFNNFSMAHRDSHHAGPPSRSTAPRTSPAITQTWPAPLAATESAWKTRKTSWRPSSAASPPPSRAGRRCWSSSPTRSWPSPRNSAGVRRFAG